MNQSAGATEQVRDFLSADARELAPKLLGAVLTHESRDGAVSVRLTEVEAY
ncbi:DNA-3-methyladenine glycosylase, partial [Arthrobacter sp. 8AJ]|uniref:DNA-3-methyladenine glycosylase n=1 Tax=Arthrobacter sp. 8AJ TaxID=2653130 RepID=UPI0019154B6E